MKIVSPKPFTMGQGKRAVLLLHGFTGHTADVRMLGRFLEKRGYTCHAPLYKGHGVSPEELLQTGPDDWWEDVIAGYEFLKNRGHREIAVAGLSLGGVFSLKLGCQVPVKGIIPMCAPAYLQSEEVLYEGFLAFAREYKRNEGKTEAEIAREMAAIQNQPLKTLKAMEELVAEVRNAVDLIYAPLFIVQARHDHMVHLKSAEIFYEEAQSELKEIKWYEESGHVITLDKERNQLHEDIYQFLEKLDWEE